MNGFFVCIKVMSCQDTTDYVSVDHITSVIGYKDYSRILLTNALAVETNATPDEVYAAIMEANSKPGSVPEVGFPKTETETEPTPESDMDAEQTSAEEDGLDEHGLKPEHRRLIEIVEIYKKKDFFGRYSSFSDMLEYIPTIKAQTKDGTEITVEDVCQNDNGEYIVKTQYGSVSVSLTNITDESFGIMLGTLEGNLAWGKAYDYACCEAYDKDCIEIYNRAQNESKFMILDNTEENLNRFGLSAGELMKAMVNGNYRKDDPYITIHFGELISVNEDDIYGYIGYPEVADWIYCNKDLVKTEYPHIYEKVFA